MSTNFWFYPSSTAFTELKKIDNMNFYQQLFKEVEAEEDWFFKEWELGSENIFVNHF